MITAIPRTWKSTATAKERVQELQITMDQFQRKEIKFKQVVEILRPEIKVRVQQLQTAAGQRKNAPIEERIEMFINERLKTDQQLYTMLRTCLNDAEQAAGMWDQQAKLKKR